MELDCKVEVESLAYEAFQVPLGTTTSQESKGESLQGAFEKYRKRKTVSYNQWFSQLGGGAATPLKKIRGVSHLACLVFLTMCP